jgi:hypothetical protein
MNLANILHPISILFEFATAVLGVMLAVNKKKNYGWCIAITFAIWVFYDLVKFMPILSPSVYLTLPDNLLYSMFFVAALSILYAVWSIYKES